LQPKAPSSAFFLFSAEMRPIVIDENPEVKGKVAEMSKLIGAKWKELTAAQKQPYELTAKAAKAEFEATYGKQIKKPRKDKKAKGDEVPGEKKKKTVSAYFLFGSSVRSRILEENPELKSKVTEVAKLIGAEWREQSDAVKESWKKKALALA
jgi:hypothetical protein